jgi:ABC-2 type transport system ATP-binding protein
LRARERITLFLTTHYMDEAENCERIAIIDHGKIVASGSPAALKAAVGEDRVELSVEDPQIAIAELRERYGIEAGFREDLVTFHVAGAEEFAPRACSASWGPGRARSGSPARRSTTSSWPTRAARSATPRHPPPSACARAR